MYDKIVYIFYMYILQANTVIFNHCNLPHQQQKKKAPKTFILFFQFISHILI